VGEKQNHPFNLSFKPSSKVDLQGLNAAWRTLVKALAISGVALGVLVVSNVAGWRARVFARLFRIENLPLIVAPPASFRPEVPLGFKVSLFLEVSPSRAGWRWHRTAIFSWQIQRLEK
jgi:hypothetical protein